MPDNVYTVGLHNVGSYQVSCHPYITGAMGDDNGMVVNSEVKIDFPTVAKAVTIRLDAAVPSKAKALRVHFNSHSSSARWEDGRHWFALSSSGDAITINAKCKEVYLTAPLKPGFTLPADNKISYTVIAELTNIPKDRMYELTGSGLTE